MHLLIDFVALGNSRAVIWFSLCIVLVFVYHCLFYSRLSYSIDSTCNHSNCLSSRATTPQRTNDNATIVKSFSTFVEYYPPPPPTIYGHVHMAKTAGTELNGMLALRYERVCGQKGNSYDAVQTNQRARDQGSASTTYASKDSINRVQPGYNRGRVPPHIMNEIGYEDCDYISQEVNWTFWTSPSLLDLWRSFPLELHVPCRNRVDHLLSNCNHKRHQFQCRTVEGKISVAFLRQQIRRCHGSFLNRYSTELETQIYPNVHVHCYDFGKQFREYLDYMDRRLQKRRIQIPYFHRDTNDPRNKTMECLWSDNQARQTVSDLLLELDYYNFCDRCLGTDRDLLAVD